MLEPARVSKYDTYTSPLAERNASPEMLRLWSPRHKFNTWRRIWLAVAEAQHELTKNPDQRARSASEGVSPPIPPTAHTPPTTPPQPELVTAEQVEELRAVVNRQNPDGTTGITDDDIRLAEKYERDLRHDVMAHVHALGDQCPKAKGIIHLGMTSQDVVCNADLLVLHEACRLVETKVQRVIVSLGIFAERTASVPCLAFTHYQPAQPVTVGRRTANWAEEIRFAWFEKYSQNWSDLMLRGLRGATGTQASFLSLLNGDTELVDRLEALFIRRLAHADEPATQDDGSLLDRRRRIVVGRERHRASLVARGKPTNSVDADLTYWQSLDINGLRRHFDQSEIRLHAIFGLTTQTYSRSYDAILLSRIAVIASVLHKITTDIRLLCNRKELDEPFEDKQIGSSAMPYKRNPMRCERICGLTRFVMNLVGNAYDTAATQWLERTLDDSSNRRLSLPEAFLALDGALDLMHNVASGLIVHEAMVKKNLMAELPFMATENILMGCVKLGGDRQRYHELIRQHAQAAGLRVKSEGLDNDLLDRLQNDKNFWSTARGGPLAAELDWTGLLDPMRYIGRSVEQTERFIKEVVEPLRERYGEAIAELGESGPRV